MCHCSEFVCWSMCSSMEKQRKWWILHFHFDLYKQQTDWVFNMNRAQSDTYRTPREKPRPHTALRRSLESPVDKLHEQILISWDDTIRVRFVFLGEFGKQVEGILQKQRGYFITLTLNSSIGPNFSFYFNINGNKLNTTDTIHCSWYLNKGPISPPSI